MTTATPSPRKTVKAASKGAPTKVRWRGRITASLLGGTLLSFAIAVAITIYMPGFDGLDQAFQGGLALVLIWPMVMLWILFATSTGRAWLRALVPLVLFVALDIAGLLL
ncbi:MAG: hypothetical protein AAF604_04030 [Acidobacteriota bacterium]